jgi:NADPH:quinone reductase-like Zn-dependent oxidoreductase
VEDWPAAAKEMSGGSGVDVVIDSVGSTWAESVASVRPGGRVVVFGGTGGATVELMVRPVTLGQVSLLGTTMGSPRDFARLLAAAAAQDWRPAIDSVRPLDEAAGAHARMEAGDHFGKLVLTLG